MVTQNLAKVEDFQPLQEFESYLLLEPIATGGEATVWTAWDPDQAQVVAIKMARAPEGLDAQDSDQEFRIVSQLDHPLVVRIYGAGKVGGISYMAMQYFPNGSLGRLLDEGRLPLRQAFTLIRYLAVAVDYIHSQGVVHRDLKPTNILLDSEYRAYLTDFGIARVVSLSTAVLHTGRGTAPYSPPEQHTKYSITNQSDIYSFGVMAFEILTGRLPFGGDAALAILQISEGRQLPDPRDMNPQLPSGLAGVLRHITALNPSDRPASALEAWEMLAAQFDLSDSSVSVTLPNQGQQVYQDAGQILSVFLNTWIRTRQPFPASLTDFALFHSIYARARPGDGDIPSNLQQFMLCGALVHDYFAPHWWKRTPDPAARLAVCARIVDGESSDAIQRALSYLLVEPDQVFPPEAFTDAVTFPLVGLLDTEHASSVLALLDRGLKPAEEWQPVAFSALDDLRLTRAALSAAPHAVVAARLIGRVRSEAAVGEITSRLDDSNTISALAAVWQEAGGLPLSVSPTVRTRVWLRLARSQLFENPLGLLRGYLLASAGFGLAVGTYIFVFYRWASFLDNSRILNAVGNGLVFGPLLGLGAFLARLLSRRLTILPTLSRILLGGFLGALLINLGIVGFHEFFLNSTPVGYMIAAMSVMICLTISAAEAFFKSRIVRVVLGIAVFAASLSLSWQAYLGYNLSPVLYFEPGLWAQTTILILVTSTLMGSLLYAGRILE